MQLARRVWRENMLGMDPKRLVFIDETWTTTNMVRSRGRSPRGRRCVGPVPHGHWKTTTFVGGLRQDRLIAPMVTDGPMDGAMFLAYTRRVLVPALQPGDVVILDNLSSHKVSGVQEAILAAAATLLYLPPYSPDFVNGHQKTYFFGRSPSRSRHLRRGNTGNGLVQWLYRPQIWHRQRAEMRGRAGAGTVRIP